MVEQELGALREVLLTSDASDAAQAEADRIRFNIRYYLRRVETLLWDLDGQIREKCKDIQITNRQNDKFENSFVFKCELMDKSPPRPNQGISPILSLARDANDIGRAIEIIRGEQRILELLPTFTVTKDTPTSLIEFPGVLLASFEPSLKALQTMKAKENLLFPELLAPCMTHKNGVNSHGEGVSLNNLNHQTHHLLLAGLAASGPSIYFDTDKAKLFIAISSGREVEPSVLYHIPKSPVHTMQLTDKSLLGPNQGPMAIPIIEEEPGNFNPVDEIIYVEGGILESIHWIED
ncbi:NF-X1 finger and helicase domain protein [Penicillium brevicompactum]|uniref:NF-X1 finger and helicase domain protein n=1 Tax=Penicillium brevicompactum TaxID=5074 RepID=A0A9W9QYV7_PENBR|nr:NF-X1 finger and helicase domain protein [Penicillium brevicompactum]